MSKKFSVKLFLLFICVALTFNLTSCQRFKLLFSRSQDLNLDGYELVFYDEFNGDILDTSVWEYRKEGPVKNKDGINHPNQVSVENGNLVITGEYTQTEYGVGWHAASVRLKEFYTYGYYEIRCIPNNSECFWSAFWLQSPDSYIHEVSQGGVYGAEVDIFKPTKIILSRRRAL